MCNKEHAIGGKMQKDLIVRRSGECGLYCTLRQGPKQKHVSMVWGGLRRASPTCDPHSWSWRPYSIRAGYPADTNCKVRLSHIPTISEWSNKAHGHAGTELDLR